MTLIKLELKSLSRGLLIWGGVLSLMLVLFMAFFPAMENSLIQEVVGERLEGVPRPLLEAFGLARVPDFSNVTVYFSYVMQYLNIAIVIYAALISVNTLIKEESYGTIEFLYAQPITRSGIVFQKMIANFLAYSSLVLLLNIVSDMLSLVFSSGKQAVFSMLFDISHIFLGTLIIGFIFMSIGFLISSKLNRRNQGAPTMMGIVFGTYIIGILAMMVDSVDFLKYLSPLELLKPNTIIENGFNKEVLGLWGIIFFICIIFTFLFYDRRDLNI